MPLTGRVSRRCLRLLAKTSRELSTASSVNRDRILLHIRGNMSLEQASSTVASFRFSSLIDFKTFLHSYFIEFWAWFPMFIFTLRAFKFSPRFMAMTWKCFKLPIFLLKSKYWSNFSFLSSVSAFDLDLEHSKKLSPFLLIRSHSSRTPLLVFTMSANMSLVPSTALFTDLRLLFEATNES